MLLAGTVVLVVVSLCCCMRRKKASADVMLGEVSVVAAPCAPVAVCGTGVYGQPAQPYYSQAFGAAPCTIGGAGVGPAMM